MFAKTKTVGNVLSAVNRDIKKQLSQGGTQLIDYCNRTSLELLRASRWLFLVSGVKEFITQKGVTDYFIGSTGQPAGSLNTGLSLTDVRAIKEGSVYDRTNRAKLFPALDAPNRLSIVQEETLPEEGRPKQYIYDPDVLDLIRILPAPDNQAALELVPNSPGTLVSAGGALGNREYHIRVTYEDELGGESAPSEETVRFPLNAELINVISPEIGVTVNGQDVTFSGWNCYIGLTKDSETKQNTGGPVAFGTNFVEPTGGLISGDAIPSASTMAKLEGYVIQFRYWENHVELTATGDILQIPDDYFDIVVAGANALAFRYLLDEKDSANYWQAVFERGKAQIKKDFRFKRGAQDFVKPDEATQRTSVFLSTQTR